MIPKEIFQNIRQIEISTSRLVTDVFAGQYHSVFKGQGIEFDEVREYQQGDEIRSIDWNVTARTGRPHVKKFIEERELTVMILVDVSASNFFSTSSTLKSRLAAEVSAMLALSAIRNNDKVGLIIFSDHIEHFIPPRKGRRHVLRVIREILLFESKGQRTDIPLALEYLNRVTARRSIAFLISDFLTEASDAVSEQGFPARFRNGLSVANKRHDLIAITLNDRREMEMPSAGLIHLRDQETYRSVWVDTSDKALRERYRLHNEKRFDDRDRLFRSLGIDAIDLYTDESYTEAMVRFFRQRQAKR